MVLRGANRKRGQARTAWTGESQGRREQERGHEKLHRTSGGIGPILTAAADIQREKEAGKMTANPAGSRLLRLGFPDYLKPGDRLSIDVGAAANQLRGLTVVSHLDQAEDAVALAVQL